MWSESKVPRVAALENCLEQDIYRNSLDLNLTDVLEVPKVDR